MPLKRVPVGIDDFKDLIEGYYYVDKTLFIKELLDLKGKVNLFTRPRRFGKTLNMSMLQYFFENTGDKAEDEANRMLFKGLKIEQQGEEYVRMMNQYPVINLSLKSSKQPEWELAYGCMKEEIGREYFRHRRVMESLETPEQRRRYEDIMNLRGGRQDYVTSVRFLSDCLYQHWKHKVIILIDEYDVPLENAYFEGFYEEMIGFIRSVFESALKSNPYLEFSVVTGCLRITRESIFTGLNNLEMISILNQSYSEYFGFTRDEMEAILDYYQLSDLKMRVKEWYDGYRFGNVEVYNPWSVVNYVKSLIVSKESLPEPYWANTSSNHIVRNLVEQADSSVKRELEELLAGGTVEKPVHEDITYDSVYNSADNLWNFLFFTGYLTQERRRMEQETQYITMRIPNLEVKYIYKNTVTNWFRDKVKVRDLSVLYHSMLEGEADIFQHELSKLLQESISYMDAKEAFYHGFILGTLGNMKDFIVKSNRESGNGRLDILVRSLDVSIPPVVMELKIADTFRGMEKACREALRQIDELGYDTALPEEGYTGVWNYGIAFFRKQCRIQVKYKEL